MALNKKQALASLSAGGKRERVNDAQMVTKLPSIVKELVEEVAKSRDVSAADVTREAIGEYLARRGYRA
jgi:hypothetical protein